MTNTQKYLMRIKAASYNEERGNFSPSKCNQSEKKAVPPEF